MEKGKATAKLKHLRKAPRKVRLLIDVIRGMEVEKAKIQLDHSTKEAAKPLLKLLNSAVANAKENNKLKEETLVITEAFVDGGPILHRWIPRAMGRATPIRKRSSHITLVLEGEVEEGKKKKKKEEKKVEEKKPVEEKKEEKKEEKGEPGESRVPQVGHNMGKHSRKSMGREMGGQKVTRVQNKGGGDK